MANPRTIVLRHGWNATVYRALDSDMEHWVSRTGDALVGFTRHAATRVVAGAPVAALDRLADVASEFEADAHRHGERVCYVCAEERLLHSAPGRYAAVRIGAQPLWRADRWAAVFDADPALRAQRNRARNKGVSVEQLHCSHVVSHPGIAACRASWLASKPMRPLSFLAYTDLAWAPSSALRDRRLFVAKREGCVDAYLVASPIPGRGGWLVEQVVRRPTAVNGTVELLVDAAVRALAADGASLVTLGLAPLAASGAQGDGSSDEPFTADPVLGAVLNRVRRHGSDLYDFAGLEAFKRKFRPERWENVYLLSREPRTSLRTLYAVGSAFCGGRPARTVLGARPVAALLAGLFSAKA